MAASSFPAWPSRRATRLHRSCSWTLSFRESGSALAESASQPVREALSAATEKGELTLKPVPAAVFRVNEKDRAWVDTMCTPHPIATLKDKISISGARDRIGKRSYVRAKGYPSIPFDAAQAKVTA